MSDETDNQELDLSLVAQMILQGVFMLMLRAGLTEDQLAKVLQASLNPPTE